MILAGAKHSEKIDDLAIQVVVGLDRRWAAIKQNSRRPAEGFAIVMTFWQVRQEPFQMAEFSAVSAKRNQAFPAPPCCADSVVTADDLAHIRGNKLVVKKMLCQPHR